MAVDFDIDFVAFQILTSTEMDTVADNIRALRDGSGFLAGAIGPAARSGGFVVGSFQTTGSTGVQSVTGLGFKPRLVEFFWSSGDGTGSGSNASRGLGHGAMDENGNMFATDFMVRVGLPANWSNWVNTACIYRNFYSSGTATSNLVAAFSSMDSDGFSINKSVAGVVTIGFKAYA